jgi:DNA ligase-1
VGGHVHDRSCIGWAALGGVAEELVEAPPGALSAAYNASSDLGQAVGDLFAQYEHLPEGEPPTVPEVGAAFEQMAAARGAAAKADVLRGLLRRCDAWCARSVAKILSGDLRIGLRSGHLEAAIAAAFDVPLADVQWAGMLTGDLGHTAELARDGRLATAELVLFRPLKSMLASPVADEAEALRRMAPPVWVEDKYDGIRAQLHKQGDDVRLYSRDLNEVTSGYPEVVEAARSQPWDGILDGELLAWRNGSALPFQLLQTRLGRKAPAASLIATVPVIFVAFDVLAFGAGGGAPVEPLVRLPLRERRSRLDALRLADQPGFGVSQLITTSTEDELGQIFDEARVRGNEGLMVKDGSS